MLIILIGHPAQAQEEGHFARVDSLHRAGQYEAAMEALEARRSSSSEDPDVLWRIARVRLDRAKESLSGEAQNEAYEQAMKEAQTAVELAPNSGNAHLALAMAAGRVGLNAGTRRKVELSRSVKEHVDRAIALDPQNDLAYHVRGRWHYEVSDLGWVARTIVKTVYGGLPDASFEKAARDLQKAIQVHERVAHHLELGKAYLKLDQEKKARTHFQKAVDLPAKDPSDPRYKEEARQLLKEVG